MDLDRLTQDEHGGPFRSRKRGRPAKETDRVAFVGGTKDHSDIGLGQSFGGWVVRT